MGERYQIISESAWQKANLLRRERKHLVRARNDLIMIAVVAIFVLAALAVKGF